MSPDFRSNPRGWYLTHTATGKQVFDFTPYKRLSPNATYQYRIESGSARTIVASGQFTTTR